MFSRAHYRRVSPPADTPADIAARLVRLAALQQAVREMWERFPVVTPENFDAANEFRERRYSELLVEVPR